jgi:hypothetical protein
MDVTVIAGREDIAAIRRIAQLHYWRHTAQFKVKGFTPRRGWTIKRFNADHGQKAKRWSDVEIMAGKLLSGGKDD